MNYNRFFNKILLEGAQLPPEQTNPSTHEIPEDAASSLFEQDFDTEDLATDGIQQEISKIQDSFEEKMSLLDDIDSLSPDEIESRLDQLEEFINNLQPFLKSKEVDMTNSYSIMANLINGDPRKAQAFENTVSAIEDYRETARKNREAVEMASKELQDKVGNLSKTRRTSQSTPEPLTTRQF